MLVHLTNGHKRVHQNFRSRDWQKEQLVLEIWDGSQLGDKLYVEIWNDNTPAPDFLIGRHEYPLEEALLCGRRPQENVVHLRQADDNRLCGSENSNVKKQNKKKNCF